MTQWEPPGSEPGLKGVSSIREPTRAERAIGRRTAEVRATIPDLGLAVEADAEPGLARARAADCSFTAVLIHACAGSLREHPRANAAYRDGRYELYSRINIAVTIFTEDGYLAPTLLDADTKTPDELEGELRRLRDRAATGRLTPPELAGATFTLTDLGPQHVTRADGFITPPQAATLVAGEVRAAPVVRDGALTAGHLISLTLACDSRILFGTTAARFLASVRERLEAAAG